jgi:hypothetical protein
MLASPAHSFLVPSPARLTTIFHSLKTLDAKLRVELLVRQRGTIEGKRDVAILGAMLRRCAKIHIKILFPLLNIGSSLQSNFMNCQRIVAFCLQRLRTFWSNDSKPLFLFGKKKNMYLAAVFYGKA